MWNDELQLHPFAKFATGNYDTLQVENIREKVIKFYEENYSANIMNLVIIGNQDLEQLQSWAKTIFSPIQNKDIQRPDLEAIKKESTKDMFPIETPLLIKSVPNTHQDSLVLYF